MTLYERDPHPHVEARKDTGPVLTTDRQQWQAAFRGFNVRFALWITNSVGTMACAYAFAGLALVSLPAALATRSVIVIVSWLAQTLLQLVLLSVIMVGQKIQGQTSDRRAEQTYLDAEAILHEVHEVHEHLEAQDGVLRTIGLALAAPLPARAQTDTSTPDGGDGRGPGAAG